MNVSFLFLRILQMIIYLTIIASSSEFILDCKFKQNESRWGQFYACLGSYSVIEPEDRLITEVRGQHYPGKSNDDVNVLFVQYAEWKMLPLNLSAFFKNLEIYHVKASNIRKLTSDDLKGFDKLRVFDVSSNPIIRLENEFFEGHSTIVKISFYDCDLRFIGKRVFDPLVDLIGVNFQRNYCIDFSSHRKNVLQQLRKHIRQCDGTTTRPRKKYGYDAETYFDDSENIPSHDDVLTIVKEREQHQCWQRDTMLIISVMGIVIIVLSCVIFVQLHRKLNSKGLSRSSSKDDFVVFYRNMSEFHEIACKAIN